MAIIVPQSRLAKNCVKKVQKRDIYITKLQTHQDRTWQSFHEKMHLHWSLYMAACKATASCSLCSISDSRI